tara:strand:+ start:274 stop:501 length:228 start_codon:yes stop_codon:yes gene_type:complete
MEELLEKYMKQYENDLKELTDKELKNDYIGWFCYDYSIEELEKVERDEMIWDMVEDKKRYAKYYSEEELKDEIKN